MLKSALAPLESRIDFAFVYGSVARGEDDEKSDVDFLIDMEDQRTLMDLAGLLGDLQIVVLGVAPIGLAGIVAALRARRWRAGAGAD